MPLPKKSNLLSGLKVAKWGQRQKKYQSNLNNPDIINQTSLVDVSALLVEVNKNPLRLRYHELLDIYGNDLEQKEEEKVPDLEGFFTDNKDEQALDQEDKKSDEQYNDKKENGDDKKNQDEDLVNMIQETQKTLEINLQYSSDTAQLLGRFLPNASRDATKESIMYEGLCHLQMATENVYFLRGLYELVTISDPTKIYSAMIKFYDSYCKDINTDNYAANEQFNAFANNMKGENVNQYVAVLGFFNEIMAIVPHIAHNVMGLHASYAIRYIQRQKWIDTVVRGIQQNSEHRYDFDKYMYDFNFEKADPKTDTPAKWKVTLKDGRAYNEACLNDFLKSQGKPLYKSILE